LAFLTELENHFYIFWLFAVSFRKNLEGIDSFYGLLQPFQIFIRRWPITNMPVNLRAVRIDDEDSWSTGNFESLKNFISGFFCDVGEEKNEIRVQKFLIFLIGEELLTQQYTAPSATREKVDKDLFAFILRLDKGLVKSPLEPVLGKSRGNKNKYD